MEFGSIPIFMIKKIKIDLKFNIYKLKQSVIVTSKIEHNSSHIF